MVLICLNSMTNSGKQAIAGIEARGGGITPATPEVGAEETALDASEERGQEVEVATVIVFFDRAMGILVTLEALWAEETCPSPRQKPILHKE